MRNFIFLWVAMSAVLLRPSLGQQSLHAYYESGDTMEQISDHGVTVTVTLRDTSKENWVWVYVANDSNDAVNIIPVDIKLHQSAPKEGDLRMKTERELGKSIGRRVFWGQIVAGIGVGLSRNVSVARTTDSYGNSIMTTVNTPDYEAQARWLAWADQLVQKGQAIKDFHQREWLRANTLFPGTRYAGRLIFIRNKKFESGMVRVTLDSKDYNFPFPPHESAKPPKSAPVLPDVGKVTASILDNSQTNPDPTKNQSANLDNNPSRAGVLGVSGANWEESGVLGVEILGVAANSAADIAGLHVGDVITDLNGRKIRSTQDLASTLKQNGPGSRIDVGYIIKTHLGWMPKDTFLILTNGQ